MSRAPAVAFGLVALHLLDDAFVHPEPGTSAADHLAAGLVPVAVCAALAVAVPRLRPGLGGAVALLCGAVVVVTGLAIPVRHALLEGPSGDDVTGWVATAAGAVLVAWGARTLWRSRRRDGPRAARWGRRAALTFAGAVAALFVAVPLAFDVIATHRVRIGVPAADLGRPYEPVTLRTADGLRLAAWYVPSRNGAAVIAFPGRRQPLPQARMLVRHGYGVLLLDRRGEGASEGDYNAYGWDGEADLRAAIAFLARRRDVRDGRIGGLGLSVGGELLLQTAAHDRALRAVVSEGAGQRSLRESVAVHGAGAYASPDLVQTAAMTVLAGQSPPPDLTRLVDRIAPRRALLLYAAHGQGGEQELTPRYARAIGPSATLWRVGRGGHTGAYAADPQAYERRVVGFFDRAL